MLREARGSSAIYERELMAATATTPICVTSSRPAYPTSRHPLLHQLGAVRCAAATAGAMERARASDERDTPQRLKSQVSSARLRTRLAAISTLGNDGEYPIHAAKAPNAS